MNRTRIVIMQILVMSFVLTLVAGPVLAQDPGQFAAGKKRVGVTAGVGSTYGQSYLILGGSFAYYLANGLELGAGVEGWLLQTPTLWKLTPQLTYIVYQAGPVKPYVGGFYRWTLASSPYEDYESYGGRGGVAYRNGGNFLALGVVYERFVDSVGLADSDTWYPEVSFWISF